MNNDNEFEVELNKLKSFAEETFGSKEAAEQWLNKPNFILGDSPLSYAKTIADIEEIDKILSSISYGGVV